MFAILGVGENHIMLKLIEAVGMLRVYLTAQTETQEAMEDLIKLAVRQQKALQFYANRENYIDGVALHPDPSDGLLSIPDEGTFARIALGEDISLGVGIRIEPQEKTNVAA
jgi:hypothetical protein